MGGGEARARREAHRIVEQPGERLEHVLGQLLPLQDIRLLELLKGCGEAVEAQRLAAVRSTLHSLQEHALQVAPRRRRRRKRPLVLCRLLDGESHCLCHSDHVALGHSERLAVRRRVRLDRTLENVGRRESHHLFSAR